MSPHKGRNVYLVVSTLTWTLMISRTIEASFEMRLHASVCFLGMDAPFLRVSLLWVRVSICMSHREGAHHCYTCAHFFLARVPGKTVVSCHMVISCTFTLLHTKCVGRMPLTAASVCASGTIPFLILMFVSDGTEIIRLWFFMLFWMVLELVHVVMHFLPSTLM